MGHSTETVVEVTADGAIELPRALRERHGLDEPGALVRVLERLDGIIELHPALPVPEDQEWFWSPEWQQMEREADEDIAAGRTRTFDSAEEFMDSLQGIVDSGDALK